MPRLARSPADRRTHQFAALAEVARVIAGDTPLHPYELGNVIGPFVTLANDLDTPSEMGCQDNIASVNRNIDDETGDPMLVVARHLLSLAGSVHKEEAMSGEDLDADDEFPMTIQNACRALEDAIDQVRLFSPHDKELLNVALRCCVVTLIDTDGPNAPVYDLTRQSASMESPGQVGEPGTAGQSASMESPGQVGEPGTAGQSDEPAECKPKWDANSRTLTYAGRDLKCYKSHPANNQVSVLASFEAAGWPCSVTPPLHEDQIRDTVRALKNSIGEDAPIRFASDGTGKRIRWDTTTE